MIKYKLIKEKRHHPDLGIYTSYGIGVYDGRTQLRKIPDISTDKRSVRKLCRLCNRLALSEEHIGDVVYDNAIP